MIVQDLDDPHHGPQLRLITQTDHAALAAEILGLWRADGLPRHPRRALLLDAVRAHDNGWWESDAAPTRRADGRPHDFRDLLPGPRREIWDRGIARRAESPWVRALIAHHAVSLHRESEGALADAVPGWRSRRDEAIEEAIEAAPEPRSIGHDADQALEVLEADYAWLALADSLSLAVCAGWPGPIDREGHRFGTRTLDDETTELWIDPFPLAGATRFRLRGRCVPRCAYESDTELALALASARWRSFTVRLTHPTPPRA